MKSRYEVEILSNFKNYLKEVWVLVADDYGVSMEEESLRIETEGSCFNVNGTYTPFETGIKIIFLLIFKLELYH